MEAAATQRRAPPLPGLIQAGLIGSLFALALVGWAITGERMEGMDAGPGTDLGTFGFYVTAWLVMMAAMMFPSIWPMVLMYQRVQQGKAERGQEVEAWATTIFVAGYLIVWTAAGLVFYLLIEVGRALSIDALSWDQGGPYLAGAVLVAAAAYQLTPLKDVCLSKCRSPLMFVLTSWHPGRLGALRMGIEHGAWCVGCCWMLMAALFALGVMSLGWMVFIAALIAIEKLLPWKNVANRMIAVLLLCLGLAVAFVPEDVPGLIIPGSPEAMQAMESMGMDEGGQGGGMKGDSMQGAGVGKDAMGDQNGTMPADPKAQDSMPQDQKGGDSMGGSMAPGK